MNFFTKKNVQNELLCKKNVQNELLYRNNKEKQVRRSSKGIKKFNNASCKDKVIKIYSKLLL